MENKLDAVLTRLDMLQDSVDDIKAMVTGNGNPGSGLLIRVDRMEQFVASAKKLVWLLIGAAVTPGVLFAGLQYFVASHDHPSKPKHECPCEVKP